MKSIASGLLSIFVTGMLLAGPAYLIGGVEWLQGSLFTYGTLMLLILGEKLGE